MRERFIKQVRNLAIGTTAAAGAAAIMYSADKDTKRLPVPLVTIEPIPTATLEPTVDTREVTRENYTQFLSVDPNITFSQYSTPYKVGNHYLRETTVGGEHEGINLLMADKRVPNKATIIDSQDKLLSVVLPNETNVDKKIQAILYALFDNIVEANQPAITLDPAVLRTTMIVKEAEGCFKEDKNGNPIMPNIEVLVTIDFSQKSIGYVIAPKRIELTPDFGERICLS